MRLWTEKPLLRSPDSYVAAVSAERWLRDAGRVLVVGAAGGRDWTWLERAGKDLSAVDIAPQADLAGLVRQSIEDRTPFEDATFDGAVVCEVLEHLFRDVDALEELHRVLRPEGLLVVTVPYLSRGQDDPEYHVRVHSPKTLRRTLERTGFRIEEHFCRGFVTRLAHLTPLPRAALYGAMKVVEWVGGRSPDDAVHAVNGPLLALERFLGAHRATTWFQRWFRSYGGVLVARRVSERRDFDAVQVAHFRDRFVAPGGTA